MIRRLAVALGAAGAAVTMLAGSAAASTGGAYYAPDQAGYTATGAHFKEVSVNAWLPDASRFSREIGRLGLSLEMRTPAKVIDLTIYACTDSTCRPGGRPVTNRYRLAFKVYNRSTHAVICSSAIATSTCPQVNQAWNKARFASGHTVGLVLFYQQDPGFMMVTAGGQRYLDYEPGQRLLINQARIGVELGGTPWSTVPFRAPAREMRLASFGVPVGPPYEAEFSTYKGQTSCLNSWWTRHQVETTGNGTAGPVEARRMACPISAVTSGSTWNGNRPRRQAASLAWPAARPVWRGQRAHLPGRPGRALVCSIRTACRAATKLSSSWLYRGTEPVVQSQWGGAGASGVQRGLRPSPGRAGGSAAGARVLRRVQSSRTPRAAGRQQYGHPGPKALCRCAQFTSCAVFTASVSSAHPDSP